MLIVVISLFKLIPITFYPCLIVEMFVELLLKSANSKKVLLIFPPLPFLVCLFFW